MRWPITWQPTRPLQPKNGIGGRVYVNDTFARCGFSPEDEVVDSVRVYTTDGLHLSAAGYDRLTDLQHSYYKDAMAQ